MRTSTNTLVEQEEGESILSDVVDYKSVLFNALHSSQTQWLLDEIDLLANSFASSDALASWLLNISGRDTLASLCEYLFLRRQSFRWYGEHSRQFFAESDTVFPLAALQNNWIEEKLKQLQEILFMCTLRDRGVPDEFRSNVALSSSNDEVQIIANQANTSAEELIVLE